MKSPTRRAALQLIANAVPVAVVSRHGLAGAAVPYQPKFFTAREMKTIDVLSEAIIPADEHSAGARAARVTEYIDVIASTNEGIQATWRRGLTTLDETCRLRFGQNFVDCGTAQQLMLLEELSAKEEAPASVLETFFVTAKKATVEGYYTSPVGIHDELEYQGNAVLANFEGCTHRNSKWKNYFDESARRR